MPKRLREQQKTKDCENMSTVLIYKQIIFSGTVPWFELLAFKIILQKQNVTVLPNIEVITAIIVKTLSSSWFFLLKIKKIFVFTHKKYKIKPKSTSWEKFII